jgi:hypothetical protein
MRMKGFNWIAVAFVMLIFLMVVSLLMANARTAAQKIGSTNNLKQLGLALINYTEAYKKYPAGCDSNANHGWLSRIQPYLEASSWYSRVDWEVVWHHPLNMGQFRAEKPSYQIPGRSMAFTIEGFGTTHYVGNSAIFHRGHHVASSDLMAGISHVFLAGEISTDVAPHGYPYNWRELIYPIGSRDSYNGWKDGSHLVMGDGSARWLSNETDRAIVESLCNAYPLPELKAYQRPESSFSTTSKRPPENVVLIGPEDQPRKGGRSYVAVWPNMDGIPEYIDFIEGYFDCHEVYERFPNVRVLRCLYPRDTAELTRISALKDLEILCLMKRQSLNGGQTLPAISMEELVGGLKRLPKLKVLKMGLPGEGFEEIQAELPQLTIIESRVQ